MKKEKEPKTLQDAFIEEVNEDLKNDQLKQIWDKYSLHIIISVVAILVAAVSFESIKAWRIRHHQENSNVYAYASNLAEQGKVEESNNVLKKIAEDRGGIYADAARMQLAKNYTENGKTEEAQNVLKKMLADSDTNPQVKNVALIKLASMQIETASYADMEKTLEPVLQNPSWSGMAKSLLALSAIRAKDIDKAKLLYGEIAADANTPDSLKAEAQDMIAILNETVKQ